MDQQIKTYVAKLDEAFKDFETNAFNNLIADLEAQQAKLVTKVAREWTKETAAKVNSKKKAIAAILARRESLWVGRAKSIATGSSTAA